MTSIVDILTAIERLELGEDFLAIERAVKARRKAHADAIVQTARAAAKELRRAPPTRQRPQKKQQAEAADSATTPTQNKPT